MTKKKGYLIPDVIETEDRVCVSFTLPDLPEYRQAALYQIMSLGKWWSWEHDVPSQGDTTAVEVGRYLLPFLNNIQITPGECPSMGDNYVMNVEETAPMEVTVTFRDDSTSVLDLTDCCEQIPPYFRKDVINGGLEFSFDGVNWEPITIPDGEPPDWPIFDGPPPGEVWVTPPDGTDKACRVANSVIDEFKEQAEALKSRIDFNAGIILSLAQFTTSIITAGVGFYFAGPAGAAAGAAGSQAFWEVIMSATDTILEMFQGYTALSYDNLFSDPVKWREVKCWYYCNLSSDGLLDYAGYQMVLLSAEVALANNPTDDFYKFMVEQIKLFGTDGPNQSYEKWMNTEDDCTACVCVGVARFYFDGDAIDIPWTIGPDWTMGSLHPTAGRDGTACIRAVSSSLPLVAQAYGDLGQVRSVNRVKYWSYAAGPGGSKRNAQIHYSEDGITWGVAWANNNWVPGTSWALADANFTAVNARYIAVLSSAPYSGSGTYDRRVDSVQIFYEI